MIKLSKLLFLASLLIFMSACGDDDEPENAALEGTWKAISFNADVESTTEFSGTTTSSQSVITGNDLNYELNLNDPNWTTSGDYGYNVNTTVDGQTLQDEDLAVSNVSGSGTYSVSGNMMTINGSFFEFEFNGMTMTSMSDSQTVEFEINSDGQLVFTQDEEMESTTSGVTSISTVKSTSVWEKQ